MGGVLERYGPTLVSNGVGDGLVQCGAECGRIGRGILYHADRSSGGLDGRKL